jgi:hypothetical protein
MRVRTRDTQAEPPTTGDAPLGVEPRQRRYLPLLHRVAGINILLLLIAVAVTIVVLVPGNGSSYKIWCF